MTLPDFAILFGASFVAAFISGTAGFGGALLLLPLLTEYFGVTTAVPVLTLAQLVGNISRVSFGFKHIKWEPVWYFLLGAIPFALIGSIAFSIANKSLITRLIGIALILFVLLKLSRILEFRYSRFNMASGGAVTGFLSGLIGSAGPLGAFFFLSLNLTPIAYIASEAFTATAMHITKIITYQSVIPRNGKTLQIGFLSGVAMILGTWFGKKMLEKVSKDIFQGIVGVLIIIIGGVMAWRG